MKSELEKCMDGEYFDCHSAVFLEYKARARQILAQYNALPYGNIDEKYALLKTLFGNTGDNVSVGQPFICDYGCNIHTGDNVSINMNCTFVDCNRITLGNNVLIAPNVQIYTSTHPVELRERLQPKLADGKEYVCQTCARPVTIGDGCWIGGGVIILPGVTVGSGTVIGAGSVVTRDIPADCVAAGNPCKVLRNINEP
jgi:acetyltransferase-like isoleucine patch superfamily enzyme